MNKIENNRVVHIEFVCIVLKKLNEFYLKNIDNISTNNLIIVRKSLTSWIQNDLKKSYLKGKNEKKLYIKNLKRILKKNDLLKKHNIWNKKIKSKFFFKKIVFKFFK